MVRINGMNGVYAEVVQHSQSAYSGDEMATFNVKYGLIVHPEGLRHRQVGRCVKSNRAIPMKKIRREVLTDPYVPVWFGAAQKGMVADEQMKWKGVARKLWLGSRYLMCGVHWTVEKLGAHKEWANRLLNPWQFVRETITATEFDNLYNLRLHPAAQKDIQEVVKCMYQAYNESKPLVLYKGEWHVPYVYRERGADGVLRYHNNEPLDIFVSDFEAVPLSLDVAIRASAARCARSSYDNHDGSTPSISRDIKLYNDLVGSDPKHASPVENQGSPFEYPSVTEDDAIKDCFDEDGTTHIDGSYNKWSGNLKGFIQYRQLLSNHTCTEYKGG